MWCLPRIIARAGLQRKNERNKLLMRAQISGMVGMARPYVEITSNDSAERRMQKSRQEQRHDQQNQQNTSSVIHG